MLKPLHIILVLSSAILLGSCSFFGSRHKEEPVARVLENYLYPSDLEDVLPQGEDPGDSTLLADRYVDTWIRDQLMLQHAEIALTEEQKDFDRQIAEYRRSLLIYSYRQKLLQQKLDTLVSSSEIEAYYNENLGNFVLGGDVIRGTYVKLPLEAPRTPEVRQWSRANNEEDLDLLEKYCLSYAEKYSNFNDTWVQFSSIHPRQLPMTISQPSRYLSYNRNIETTDSLYRYFLHITDHLPEGETAPLDLVSGDIKNIILNKRKIEFFHELERNVYNEGLSKNQFEVY